MRTHVTLHMYKRHCVVPLDHCSSVHPPFTALEVWKVDQMAKICACPRAHLEYLRICTS